MPRRKRTGTDLWQDIPRGGSSWGEFPEAAAGVGGRGFAVGRRLGWLRLSEIRDTVVRDEARGRTGLDQGGPGEEDGFKPQDGI